MQLLVIRHAPAGDKVDFAQSGRADGERPLTEEGRRKMRDAAKGLARLVERLDVLASSPLLRALQTAEIVAATYDSAAIEKVAALVPGSAPADLVPWLAAQTADATVAVVGHEPHLSGLVSWLLTGATRPVVELGKGAACLLELERPAARHGILLWLAQPRALRRLGR